MKKKFILFLFILIYCFVLTGCEEVSYVNTSEFRLKLFNNDTLILGFNDEFYTEHLVIEENVTYYCERHKKNETRYISSVEDNSFQNKNLESVTINGTEKSKFSHIMDYAFADNIVLTVVNLPNSIRYIGDFAFSNNNLKTINLTNIRELGSSVFLNNYNLELVNLVDQVQKIGDLAFENCNDKLMIKLGNPIPPKIGNDIFKGIYHFKIIVPENLLETYKNADGWSLYSSQIFAN